MNGNGVVGQVLNLRDTALLAHVVCLGVDDPLLVGGLPVLPELPGVRLVLRVLGVPEDEHNVAPGAVEGLHGRLGRVAAILQGYAVKLA